MAKQFWTLGQLAITVVGLSEGDLVWLELA